MTQADLAAAGLPAGTDPRRLRLFAGGVEQAIRVNGEADGTLDSGDSLEFYGLGLDTPSTETRVYWLTAGSTLGLRLRTAAGQYRCRRLASSAGRWAV